MLNQPRCIACDGLDYRLHKAHADHGMFFFVKDVRRNTTQCIAGKSDDDVDKR